MKTAAGSIFEIDGIPKLSHALPMAMQHVVAMIVGCVTPAIITSGVAGLNPEDKLLLIQTSLFISAISTLFQLFPIWSKKIQLGSGIPMIVGISFAYVPTMQAIAASSNMATILGAQIIGGIVAIIVGMFVKKIRPLFPPLVTGTVVFTIGLSLYPTAINYMAGGNTSPNFGSWQNWIVALFTLAVVTGLNHFSKGILKLASILVGIAAGYIMAFFFGLVDISGISSAGYFAVPKLLHFGLEFDVAACTAIGILFAINSIQAIGDFTATTTGAMDREPLDREIQGGIVMYGISNIIGALLGGLPTATYSQNVGIITTTKVINRCVLGLAAVIIMIAGFLPKFSAALTTIPYCVLGGATVSVFASISVTGIKLITKEPLSYRNASIVGLAVALGVGITQTPACLAQFPESITTIFGKSPVVIATITAIILNLILPKDTADKK